MYQWRKFQFFEERPPSGDLPDSLRGSLTCCTSGRGQLAFGGADGIVHLVERGFRVKATFQAYKHKILRVYQLRRSNQLVTLGEDEPSSIKGTANALLKLWDLDRWPEPGLPAAAPAPSDGASTRASASTSTAPSGVGPPPMLVRSVPSFPPKSPEARVTAFAVLEESEPVLRLALGLESGEVILVHGDVARGRITRTRLPADSPADGWPGSAITGLVFRLEPASTTTGSTHLFAVSATKVVAFSLQHQQQPMRAILDEHGCDPNCIAASDSSDLVLGRPEAVYFYGPDGRGPCWAFEGEKRYVAWFRGYLLAAVADPRRAERSVLNVYDLRNRLIVHSVAVGIVEHVVFEWGMVLVVTAERKVLCLAEKDMASKLELLYNKSLYAIAINLVQTQQADAAATAEVMRKYGDHLYAKQDYEEAMAQYIRTIGQLEPSYVIQKFLDAQRIHNLTHYLERLHDMERASSDHTTLLLNCYTKLKDVGKLDTFIKGEGAASGRRRFDEETAIRVCRSAGFFEHALWVAETGGKHEWYLRILLEDLKRYEEALKYIGTLGTLEAAIELLAHGKLLLTHRPGDTTALLVRLCTEPPLPAATPPPPPAAAAPSPPPSIPQPITPPSNTTAPQRPPTPPSAPSSAGTSSSQVGPVSGPSNVRNSQLSEVGGPAGPGTSSKEAEGTEETERPLPTEFVQLFVDRPRWLMRFLEQYNERVKVSVCDGDVSNILLELYLSEDEKTAALQAEEERTGKDEHVSPGPSPTTTAEPIGTAPGREAHQKALTLLRVGWPPYEGSPKYSLDLALVLCQMHRFTAGLLFLYERMKLYREVLACYMGASDHAGLVACCRRLGDSTRGGDPSLWAEVLAYFGDKGGADCEKEVKEVLDVIERNRLLPPLIVLQTLARNKHLKLALVRDYVARQIGQETRLIEEDRKAIDKYQEETATMRAEVAALRSGARVFQATKCAACSQGLDLPALHFLCMHSFHARCLGDSDRECPLCAPANHTVLEMKRSLEQNADDHDRFFQLVQNSSDGFSVIAEYFGRGVLNKGDPKLYGAGLEDSRQGVAALPDVTPLILT